MNLAEEVIRASAPLAYFLRVSTESSESELLEVSDAAASWGCGCIGIAGIIIMKG